MGLHPDFPTDPYAVLDPAVRWYPGEEMLGELGYAMLLPPLVHKVRQGVKAWRDSGYAGASATTRALLLHWFRTEHLMAQADGTVEPFRWYFAQQEAVELALWLYEVERARDPYALMRYDSSGRVSKGMFDEDWTRYVLKLATGAGKTKVMSLLMAWSYFHKLYEPDWSFRPTSCSLRRISSSSIDCGQISMMRAFFSTIPSCRTTAMRAAIGMTISS